MKKDYSKWHSLKCKVHEHENKVYCKSRDVWWVCLGHNVGFEQDGKGENFERPVVVLKVFNTHLFLGIPLTSKDKNGKYYFPLEYNNMKSLAVLSQARVFSNKRLLNKVGVIPIDMFNSMRGQYIATVVGD